MTDVPSHDAATAVSEPAHPAGVCRTCPVCQMIVALRGEGAELSDVVAQTGSVLRQVLSTWLEDKLGGFAESSEPDGAAASASGAVSEPQASRRERVQRIRVE